MKKLCLALLLLGMFATSADAYWVSRLVPESYEVTVHPQPYWTCSGWVVPTPYKEVRTRWVNRSYWVEPPRVLPQPIFIQPQPSIIIGPPVHYHFCW